MNESGGIDDFKMTAQGTCGLSDRLLLTYPGQVDDRHLPTITQEQDVKHKEEQKSFEDESPYCQSKDFPCEGGANKVYVCHYSGRQGYQTFCIPETDSDILRFYHNDYCGPCVGGYGGVNNMK